MAEELGRFSNGRETPTFHCALSRKNNTELSVQVSWQIFSFFPASCLIPSMYDSYYSLEFQEAVQKTEDQHA